LIVNTTDKASDCLGRFMSEMVSYVSLTRSYRKCECNYQYVKITSYCCRFKFYHCITGNYGSSGCSSVRYV